MGIEKEIFIQGKRYSSLLEAADEFGVHKSTLARRLRYGWTPEQAVGIAENPKRIGSAKKVVYKGHTPPESTKYTGKEITVQGKTYKSIAAAAAEFGISAEPFRLRMLKGMTPEQALSKARVKK